MKKLEPLENNSIYAKDREEWRYWLKQNHTGSNYVWLIIYHKDSGVPSVSYDHAVEEALCFGWIDSKPNKRDGLSYFLFFAKRSPDSNWSRANRERAERMMEQGKMTPAGLQAINSAKESGKWTALETVQELTIPSDLELALEENEIAREYFLNFPPSSKRIILEWIMNAKMPETRRRRIEETVRLASNNIRANHYRRD